MGDVKFQVGVTVVAVAVFVVGMAVAELADVGGMGVLVALAAFILVSAVAGMLISRRAYS